MAFINARHAQALNPNCYSDTYSPRWRPVHRIDTVGGSVKDVINAKSAYPFEKLIYAEGDSWFDKFTPIFEPGTNLLEAIRLPMFAGVVDVAHIGDVSADMVIGYQRKQTNAMFKLFEFDAILFSGGGNDLKNLFAQMYDKKGEKFVVNDNAFFDLVIENIKAFVAMRDDSPIKKTREAPIFVNGYDYFQPRPVKGAILGDLLKVAGPWLYPSMHGAGLSDADMLASAKMVITKLNSRLKSDISTLPNVHVIDQRGLLTLAAPGSTTASGDWLDEIHPTAAGFNKLAKNRWDYAVAKGLGWIPRPEETTPPKDFTK